MKKILIVFVFLFMTGSASFAQPFAKGNHAINLGLGIGNAYYFGSFYSGFLPSFSGSYEYGIVEIPMGSELTGVIGVGGYLGWSASKYGSYYGGDDHYNIADIVFGVRGNYHFIFHDKFDPYAGLWFGVDVTSAKWKGSGQDPDVDLAEARPIGGAYVGARYFFTDNFAVYSELGYLISVLNVGVTFKF